MLPRDRIVPLLRGSTVYSECYIQLMGNSLERHNIGVRQVNSLFSMWELESTVVRTACMCVHFLILTPCSLTVGNYNNQYAHKYIHEPVPHTDKRLGTEPLGKTNYICIILYYYSHRHCSNFTRVKNSLPILLLHCSVIVLQVLNQPT